MGGGQWSPSCAIVSLKAVLPAVSEPVRQPVSLILLAPPPSWPADHTPLPASMRSNFSFHTGMSLRWSLFFRAWLISLHSICQAPPRCLEWRESHSFLWLNNIPLRVCVPLFLLLWQNAWRKPCEKGGFALTRGHSSPGSRSRHIRGTDAQFILSF